MGSAAATESNRMAKCAGFTPGSLPTNEWRAPIGQSGACEGVWMWSRQLVARCSVDTRPRHGLFFATLFGVFVYHDHQRGSDDLCHLHRDVIDSSSGTGDETQGGDRDHSSW